jgi:hypothetical protein
LQRHPPLEQQRQQRVVDRLAEVDRVPLLILGDPQDAVADIVVLADHVGERVVQEVVRVLPLLGRAGGVPLPGAGVDLRVVHPVELAVHDVVADLHVFQDLPGREHRRPGNPGRGKHAGEQCDPASDHQTPLDVDHPPDVGRVLLAPCLLDVTADLVELSTERLDVLVAEVGKACDIRNSH